jgi:hypothetical protein
MDQEHRLGQLARVVAILLRHEHQNLTHNLDQPRIILVHVKGFRRKPRSPQQQTAKLLSKPRNRQSGLFLRDHALQNLNHQINAALNISQPHNQKLTFSQHWHGLLKTETKPFRHKKT